MVALLNTEAERGNPPQSDTIADTVADVVANAFADSIADTIADAFADSIAYSICITDTSSQTLFGRQHRVP